MDLQEIEARIAALPAADRAEAMIRLIVVVSMRGLAEEFAKHPHNFYSGAEIAQIIGASADAL